ncbi:helix-turn-helix domain-containing protein [Brevibacillus choshinensis]|uniref:Helix-turn-helix transcriptional regulator n=1 Tax=Brevibacillus choshinensis TaxID=54911 RepID=A0ABX7FGG4_BRECH|nr:helix-turn-helix transcriptional regulator [Brevibacillus choshinensis]QRG65284.1 helix-turn-helix transcriptional regulator [Brevibacillus choshinensis]
MNLAELKKLRIQKSIPLHEMAKALGLKTAGGYLRIENGENKLKAEHLPRLAIKFELSLDELMAHLFLEEELDECSSF